MEVDGNDQPRPDSKNLKYIKPLLGASSRLGRALAELFGLLVKLCVGSPVRQRRGPNIIQAPPTPSTHARKVALALNILLAKGLDCDSLPPCPTPKCRLTFLICSVGFTSPMLFDERRYPYYLMLKKFVTMGGQATFFKTFRWALQGDGDGPSDVKTLPEGTLGFLDAWLTLLEKMVNPKTILESPHVIAHRANLTYSFDPLKYLIQIHRLAFDSIERLWKNTSITSYGVRITETVLTILKHIYWGEKIIKERLKQEEARNELSTLSTSGPATTRDNDDNLRQLIDMGFSREHAIEALSHSTTLEQATDYLLSHPPHSRAATSSMDVESAEDDQVMQAIVISLGCNNTLENPHATVAELKILLDEFTKTALSMCLELLNIMPDLVHRACELLVTIMKRNGKCYRDDLLETVVKNILENALEATVSLESSRRLANYTHLFILFYEVASYYEMKFPFMAIFGTPLVDLIIYRIRQTQHSIRELTELSEEYCREPPEPRWLSPCLLLIDAYSKVANRTERKCKMHISTTRIWRWYDLVTGRWTHYSTTNNRIINEAYWAGEQSVRVTCGRKRYTITFPNMLQINDETGNNRPIAMALVSLTHGSNNTIHEPPPEDPIFAELTAKERNQCIPIPPLSKTQMRHILKSCVSLMHMNLRRDLLHSILQVCVRFTRDFEMARVFVLAGGIKCLLRIRHIADFGGFAILATILIRHALEEPNTLTYAMEKVIRGRALSTIPPPYRDLVYLTRQLGAALIREPNVFFQVAKNILRVDTSAEKPGEPLDVSFPLRVEPPTRSKAPPLDDPVSIMVIYDLLDALLRPLTIKSKEEEETSESSSSDSSPIEVASSTSSGEKTDTSKGTSTAEKKEDKGIIKPMLPKAIILKILADAVVSYVPIAKLVTEYIYKADCVEMIKEDTPALAFIFDKILPECDNISDNDCSAMGRMLIAALASANHSPEAQIRVVSEVKAALGRALAMPESAEKHSQIQHICGVISTMIDTCPLSTRSIHNISAVNNIIKMMIRRGLFNDLAKISHSLDLSSPHTSFTANAALKPLESLSRTINQPGPTTVTAKGRKPSTAGSEDSAAGTSAHAETSARLDEEDTENAEDNQSDANTDRNEGEGERDRLEEIMEQILDGATERVRNSTMEIDDGDLNYDPERDPTEELMSTDSGESDSNASDDNDEDGNNDDDDAVDVNIDENDDNDENNYEDDDNNDSERRSRDSELLEEPTGLFRVATNREEDVLMIHYDGENDTALPRMIRWNEHGYAYPMLDDNSGDHVIIHPLLLSRNGNDTAQNTVPRNQRTNRPRRYQYLLNPRNPNPPVILQRLLGTHDPHAMATMMTANNILTAPPDIAREQARVVIMDNFGIIPPNEEQIDFVDQSGYLFGPSLTATLSHVPPVVHWWNMEAKLLDLESVFDCTSWICNRLVPILVKYRNDELVTKQDKEEEEKSKKMKAKSETGETEAKEDEWDIPQVGQEIILDLPVFGDNNPERAERGSEMESAEVETLQQNQGADRDPIVVIGVPPPSTLVINYPIDASSGGQDSVGPNGGTDQSSQTARTQGGLEISPLLPSFPPNLELDAPFGTNLEMSSQSSTTVQTQTTTTDEMGQAEVTFCPNTRRYLRREGDESESEDGNRFRRSSPASLQAIFEEAINQQVEEYSTRDQTNEGTSSSSSSGPQSQFEEAPNTTSLSGSRSNRETGEASSNTEIGQISSNAGPSSALDDEEIPEGVDPSFLEALPPEMRREVLEQHRILCLQQRLAARAAEAVATTGETSNSTEGPQEVSPEFLAALPPALQEEVLTQQRLEQQRQAAARAPPNEPVDAHAFFQTLQPSLRTMILSDMEDSQMSALPPELAAEAQNLRRDWHARNRQIQDRFLHSNLPTIIRHSRGGRQGHRPINFHRSGWSHWSRELISSNSVRSVNNQLRIRGRQLLDHEGIACLLILLFTDDPHLNKLRLHRVIRNLCYHAQTREWIINALLAIIDKSVHAKPDDNLNRPLRKTPRVGPLTSKLQTDSRHLNTGGHWLTIRMEAALGCAANVFLLNKGMGKKVDRQIGSQSIGIHPQAAPVVCRNTLDLFTALAKAFPSCLLPIKLFREDALDRTSVTPVKLNAPGQPDFWDVLLKLDSAGAKKGKSIAKPSINTISSDNDNLSFENTVFGRLLNMLGSPVVNKNTQLTDNLLKLLSVTTAGMPELVKPHRLKKPGSHQSSMDVSNNPPINALSLAVNVITYKNCSEEGLEFITNLLLNLASSSQDMSYMILKLLLNGAVEIGLIVEKQIQNMLVDLQALKDLMKKKTEDKEKDSGPSTSKGVIYNRFTNEQVIVTASTKVKATCELQLPSMVPLTSKSSSQLFFLRVLRVIVQIRNSIKNNIKRNNLEAELPALSEQLDSLESLWATLSRCLLDLEHAPDHHAVLVLQPAVEAFFLVHSPQQGAVSYKYLVKEGPTSENGDTQAQSSHSETSVERVIAAVPAVHPGLGENSNEGPSRVYAVPADVSTSQEEASRTSFDFEHRLTEQGRSRIESITLDQQKFLAFAEKHRTVLNQILRQSTAHLADGPFAVLVDHTRILDFDIKRRYFRTELERMDHGIRREETAVHVKRSNVFEDSFRELFRRAPEEWKNRFYIVFEEEEGQDAGGLLREWYVIISRDIFNPMYALFTVSPGDRVTYMINSASHYNSNHLCYYKFVGRVIAKAIYDNKLLECYFTRSFYKHILGIRVKYTDMESEDYSFYRGLVYLMENNINNLGLDLTFSTEISEFGVTETRDLIPNGRHIPVTEENKMEYVRLVCQMKMTGAIKQQLTAFLEGFYDIIPMRLISIFNEQELELLISGLPNVDIDDLKANTEYHKYQSNSLQIQWFWRALRSFDQAERAKFLQFVTGTSKVPLQGFGALEGMNGVQKFQIHRDDRSTDRLPSAHTCFNQLDLPVYETYDKLRTYLLKAIHECSEGFGFA
ncbi:hypothetical protein ABEB36_010896 [Hypothenemus hampei]|uniref:HECT-type E3 ubiquitin transferase n=1 Tax=Hypothenemus hampei TaxID=57062 RepID=A0ABD1EDD9_HYPHA